MPLLTRPVPMVAEIERIRLKKMTRKEGRVARLKRYFRSRGIDCRGNREDCRRESQMKEQTIDSKVNNMHGEPKSYSQEHAAGTGTDSKAHAKAVARVQRFERLQTSSRPYMTCDRIAASARSIFCEQSSSAKTA